MTITVGKDHACKAIGIGTIRAVTNGGKTVTLNKVLYAPTFLRNILSIRVLHEASLHMQPVDTDHVVFRHLNGHQPDEGSTVTSPTLFFASPSHLYALPLKLLPPCRLTIRIFFGFVAQDMQMKWH